MSGQAGAEPCGPCLRFVCFLYFSFENTSCSVENVLGNRQWGQNQEDVITVVLEEVDGNMD